MNGNISRRHFAIKGFEVVLLILLCLSVSLSSLDTQKTMASNYTASGLVLSYNLNEESGSTTAVTDSSGLGHDGTVNGGASWGSGNFALNGSNYITVSGNNSIHGTAFSYDTWLSFSALAEYNRIIDDGGGGGFKLQTRSYAGNFYPAVYFSDANGAAAWSVSNACGISHNQNCGRTTNTLNTNDTLLGDGVNDGGTALVADGTVYHIVLTYSAGTVQLYLNNVLVGQATTTASYTTNSNPITIGSNAGGGGNLHATLKRASIYNKVLSGSEVGTNYAAGADYNYTQTVSAANSTVSPTSATILDNGAQTTVTVTLKDEANSYAVAGKTITLASSRGSTDTITPASATTNASGVATFNFSTRTSSATPVVLTATDTTDSIVLTPTVSLTVNKTSYTTSGLVLSYNLEETSGTPVSDSSGAGNGGVASTASWSSGNFIFNGSNKITVGGNNSIHGTAFSYDTWVSFSGLGEYSRIIDDGGGTGFKLQIRGSYPAVFFGDAHDAAAWSLSNTCGSSHNQACGSLSSAWATNDTLIGNGPGSVALATNGTIYHIVLTYSAGTAQLYLNDVLVGQATTTATYSTNANPITIGSDSGSSGSLNGTMRRFSIYNKAISSSEVGVNNVAGSDYDYAQVASAASSTLSASKATILNNGSDSSTVTVTVRDANGYPMTIPGDTVALTSDRGDTITPSSTTTNASGIATFTVRSTMTPGTSHLTATINGVSGPLTAINVTDVDITQSTIVSQHRMIPADGTTTTNVIVTALNASGSPLSGKSVSLTNADSYTTIAPGSATTDSNGKATFAVKSNKGSAYNSTYGATINGVPINATTTINYQPVNIATDYNVTYTTSSTFDSLTLTLDAVYDKTKTNMPVMLVLSPYGSITDATYLNQLASEGILAVRTLKRGCSYGDNQDTGGGCPDTGSVHPDDSGRESQDFIDAMEFVKAHYAQYIDSNNINVMGFSGGGGNAYSLVTRFPDYFRSAQIFFGISDYGHDPTYGWYQNSGYDGDLNPRIGGTPTTAPDKYYARDFVLAAKNNKHTNIQLYNNNSDTIVLPNNATQFHDASVAAGNNNVTTNFSSTLWGHSTLVNYADLPNQNSAGVGFVPGILAHSNGNYPNAMLDPTGDMFIPGFLRTKQFQVVLGDGENAVGDVNYNISADGNSLANAKTFTIARAAGMVAASPSLSLMIDNLVPSTSYYVNDNNIITTGTTDTSGNLTVSGTLTTTNNYEIYRDITPPSTSALLSPTAPDGSNNYYKTAPTLTLNASDTDSGVAHTYYKWNTGAYKEYTGQITAPEGTNTLYYYSIDNAGNTESVNSKAVQIDITAPSVSLSSPSSTSPTTTDSFMVVSGSATDAGSGISTLTINGVEISNPSSFSATAYLNLGLNTVSVVATDLAGNSTTKTLSITRTTSTTTDSAASSTPTNASSKTSTASSTPVTDNNAAYTNSLTIVDNNTGATTQLSSGSTTIPSFTTQTPTFEGKTIPNATVVLEVHSDPITLTTTSDENGNWSVTLNKPLDPGQHTVTVTIKDKADTILDTNQYSFQIVNKAQAKNVAASSQGTNQSGGKTKFNAWLWIVIAVIVFAGTFIALRVRRNKQ